MATAPNDAAPQAIAMPAGLPNASQPLPGVVTAGQPSASHLEELARSGVAVVLDLRTPAESRGFDEAALAAHLGVEYHNVPVGATIGAAELDTVREFVRSRGNRAILIHCKSANRVGAALLPALILDERRSRDAAIETALDIGLRSEELARDALAYVDTQQRCS